MGCGVCWPFVVGQLAAVLLRLTGCDAAAVAAGGGSLYSPADDVVVLDLNNFNRTVLGSANAWLIEFYSSWCGHCIRYAPVYKQLASEVAGKSYDNTGV